MKPINRRTGPPGGLLAVIRRTRYGWYVGFWYARDGQWRRGDGFTSSWRAVRGETLRQLANYLTATADR